MRSFNDAFSVIAEEPIGFRRPAGNTIPDKVDIDVILIGRSVPLQIAEEAWLIRQHPLNLEVAKLEGAAAIGARRPVLHHLSGHAGIRDGRCRDGSPLPRGPKPGYPVVNNQDRPLIREISDDLRAWLGISGLEYLEPARQWVGILHRWLKRREALPSLPCFFFTFSSGRQFLSPMTHLFESPLNLSISVAMLVDGSSKGVMMPSFRLDAKL
jgi:hypothetical protein